MSAASPSIVSNLSPYALYPWLRPTPVTRSSTLRLASVGDLWNLPGKPLTKERRAQLALLLQEIRGFIEIPRPLSVVIDELPRFVDAPSDRVAGRAVPDIESSITFNLHSHGQISGTIVELPALLPQLDSALIAAPEKAAPLVF